MDELPVYFTLKQALNWVLFRNPTKLDVMTLVELLSFNEWSETKDTDVIQHYCNHPLDSPIAIQQLSRTVAENALCHHLQKHGAVVSNIQTNLPVEIEPFEFASCSIGYDLDDTYISFAATFRKMYGVQVLSQLLFESFPHLAEQQPKSTNQLKIDYGEIVELAMVGIDEGKYKSAYNAALMLSPEWWRKTGNASENAFTDGARRAIKVAIDNKNRRIQFTPTPPKKT